MQVDDPYGYPLIINNRQDGNIFGLHDMHGFRCQFLRPDKTGVFGHHLFYWKTQGVFIIFQNPAQLAVSNNSSQPSLLSNHHCCAVVAMRSHDNYGIFYGFIRGYYRIHLAGMHQLIHS
jgi:hypothetical protein